jgi:hypothetical protein
MGTAMHALGLAVALLGAQACGRHASVEVPPELTGFWGTAAPRYQDRNLEFTDEFVIFWSGPRSASHHRVTGVEKRLDETGKSSIFDIEYVQEGEKSILEVHFVAAPEPLIRLRNQVGVTWQRIASSSAEVN